MFTRKNLCITLSIVAILLVGSTISADEPEDWTGWYGGAFGGYVSGELNSDDPAHKQSTGDYDDDSPIFGISVGYQRRYQSVWIAGVEVMLPLYMQKGTAVDKQFHPDSVTYEACFQYGVLVAGKFGRDFGNKLPYAFFAVGLTNVDGKSINVNEMDIYEEGFIQSAKATHFIWQIGAGLDYQVKENVFIGVRLAAFTGAKADHTMPWNEPGPNNFGYNSMLIQFNGGYWF